MTKKNTAATVATIIVAVLAIAATLFLLYKMSQEQTQENDYGFVPSEEINNEMNDNAVILVKNNCEIFRVFMQYGLPHEDEPYGNKPEDGLYTVKSDTYKTMADLEKLVQETFVEDEAKRVFENINGNGPVFKEEINYQGEKGIGLVETMVDDKGKFKAFEYGYSWTNAKVSLSPKTNSECDINIELAKEGSEDFTDSIKLTATMVKANGKWLLEKLVY